MSENKYYFVTTPIYYVNDKPHIGHFYTNIAADILGRFKRLDGYSVIFTTGVDEHGQKIERSAQQQCYAPLDFVNTIVPYFQELNTLGNIQHDRFMRTTSSTHQHAVKHLWNTLADKGYIYLDYYKGWYSVKDEAYYSENEITKDANGDYIATDGAKLEWREEETYFFQLSKLEERLLAFYQANPEFIAPKSRYNEVISFVKQGLKDLAISRSTINWGIKVPNNPKHVIYVWLDALTNYISALNYPYNDINHDVHWQNSVHLIGKDIIKFHGIFWIAFLLAAGINPPKRLFAHGWWLHDGDKISKSLGNTIDPHDLVKTYGLDQVRYFLFKEITFGNDGNFTKQSIINKINNELANEYGNLVQRSLSMIVKHFDSLVVNLSYSKEQIKYLDNLATIQLDQCRKYIDNQQLSQYLNDIWEHIRYANAYLHANAPWSLIKDGAVEKAKNILFFVFHIIRQVTILLYPFLPDACEKIFNQLGLDLKKVNFEHLNMLDHEVYAVNLNSGVAFSKIV